MKTKMIGMKNIFSLAFISIDISLVVNSCVLVEKKGFWFSP